MVCPHLANAMPLGCAATLSTQPLWPENDSRTAPPSSTSCMLTCMSSDAVSSVLQSGMNESERTGLVWPSHTHSGCSVVQSHTATVPSDAPHATRLPSGAYAMLSAKRCGEPVAAAASPPLAAAAAAAAPAAERSTDAGGGSGSSATNSALSSRRTRQTTTPPRVPPATASTWPPSPGPAGSGANARCHVSLASAWIMATVLWSERLHTRTTESSDDDATYSPVASTATDTTPMP
mmetsp:Transcript_30007/g.88998  ORF Transcript_30007/g.88998 Transcript_30007/m.88998 type:complete len:235 (-) Transcript_30007:857-1561(-)